MRYAIISDIHGNLEAFEAALGALDGEKIDEILCAGDIVGYGADPASCVKKIRELGCVTVCGNHDAAVSGRMGTAYFNDAARKAISWTRNNIKSDAAEFLGNLALTHENRHFVLVHGTLHEAREFHYMLDQNAASETFRLMKKRLCFVGHSHLPGVFMLKRNIIDYSSAESVDLKAADKAIINAGSVGQPRDGDPRLCYAIYDTDEESITFRRERYDITPAQDKILDAGLPFILAYRLSRGT